jgi:hypothetical protein
MAVNLYEQQKKAVSQLKPGSILVGGVGTGKSITSLAFFYEKICGGKIPRTGSGDIREMANPTDLYIITTAKKRDSLEWDEELSKFCLSRNEGPVKVVVDSWNNIKKYINVSDAFFIFDEQRLVGTGAWTKSFWKITKNNKWILLTATPGDAWVDYGPVFVANGFYRNITDFRRQHVVYDAFKDYPSIRGYLNTRRLELNRRRIVVVMPVEKTAVRHDEWVKVGYDNTQYDFVKDNLWDVYKDEPVKNGSVLCYVLRKVINSDKRRLEAVGNIFANHPRCIIFYNFDYELEMLLSYFSDVGIPFSQYNGHKHEDIPEGNSWAYIVQYTSGCEGWNCVTTDTIIFFSQNYSGKVMEQASGRIDRVNTPYSDLFYYHLFSDATIDKSIRSAVRKKKTFNITNFVRSLEHADSILAQNNNGT